jgi:sulfite reductase alpha subunit-like flavoprotein
MKTLHIQILYGSQTGNSEAAAQNLSSVLPAKLSNASIVVTCTAMELDDFLEKTRAAWTPLCVIVCSSYGVGQAPIGAWKFRELCDLILKTPEYEGVFKGLRYAMLGLGDSKYTTFFQNPTALDSALTKAGAERIGPLGKADASGTGDNVQLKVIEDWSENIIADLKKVVQKFSAMDDSTWRELNQDMKTIQGNTGDLCSLIYKDWQKKEGVAALGQNTLLIALMVPLILAIAVAYIKSAGIL